MSEVDPVFEANIREILIKISGMLRFLREEERKRFQEIARKHLRGETLKKVLREIGED